MKSWLDQYWEDIRCYHRLRHPTQPSSFLSRLGVALTSRGLWQLFVHRFSTALHAKRHQAGARHPGWLALAYLLTPIELSIKVITKNEIFVRSPLSGGIYLADRGHIMLGAQCVGRGCVIHHNVTVGIDLATGGAPEIGANVWIGPESIVFGAIRIGDGCTVLPGSVLTKSVPARTVVQGNPARVIRRDFDNSQLLAQRDPDAGMGIPASQAAG